MTEPIKLDHLGPIIVNTNGTLARIPNWNTLTEREQTNTLRLIAKRNKERMEYLKENPPPPEIIDNMENLEVGNVNNDNDHVKNNIVENASNELLTIEYFSPENLRNTDNLIDEVGNTTKNG
eukprot:gene17083-23500_t